MHQFVHISTKNANDTLFFRLGHPQAQHIVAESMFHGKGVEKNVVSFSLMLSALLLEFEWNSWKVKRNPKLVFEFLKGRVYEMV